MPPYSLADPPVLAFLVLPAAIAGLFVWGTAAAWRRTGQAASSGGAAVRAAAGALIWMGVTLALADRGTFTNWNATPPPFALLVVAIIALGVTIAFSPVGARLAHLPLWTLVAVQAFRLPLEIAMHALVSRGIMPEQMSYTGRNFDVLTGASAVIVAVLVAARVGGRRLVTAWNVGGLILLVNIVVVAILSTPKFAAFGPDRLNVFVFYPPFVWLPAVLVLAALAGHLIVFRALALIACLLLFVAPASAQRADTTAPRFEVASIKEIQHDDPRRLLCGLPPVERSGNRVHIFLAQLCGLIRVAYDVGEFQVTGIPANRGVGAANYFEIEALVENGGAPGVDGVRPMLRTLLAERFQLQVRREPVEMPVFVLVQESGRKATAPCPDLQRGSGYGAGRIVSCTPPLPMARFAQFLSNATGRMVVDKSGLEPFSFELRWQPDSAEPQPDSPPSLVTAIREQLGLRLEAQRAPVDSIVVTRAERPTPN